MFIFILFFLDTFLFDRQQTVRWRNKDKPGSFKILHVCWFKEL